MDTKKEQILQTSLLLFNNNGYENTPTSAISLESGVATGTLFHHFKNKQQILNQLYIDSKLSLKAQINVSLEENIDDRDKLFLIWQRHTQWAFENPHKFRFLDKYSDHSLITSETKQKVGNTYTKLINLVRKLNEQGLTVNLPLDYLVMLTQIHFSATAKYCINHPKALKKKKLAKRMFNSYWRSITD